MTDSRALFSPLNQPSAYNSSVHFPFFMQNTLQFTGRIITWLQYPNSFLVATHISRFTCIQTLSYTPFKTEPCSFGSSPSAEDGDDDAGGWLFERKVIFSWGEAAAAAVLMSSRFEYRYINAIVRLCSWILDFEDDEPSHTPTSWTTGPNSLTCVVPCCTNWFV